jgi:hypothetical protein
MNENDFLTASTAPRERLIWKDLFILAITGEPAALLIAIRDYE